MTNKAKFIGLVFGGIFLLFLSYFLAVSKTVKAKKEYSGLKKQRLLYADISKQLQVYSKKEVYYDSILQSMNLTDTSLENNLLQTLNDEAKNQGLKLKEFNTPHVFVLEGSKYVTYDFILEGSYTGILKSLYLLEKSNTYGEVIHVDLNKETNFRTRKKSLTAKVLVQNIQ